MKLFALIVAIGLPCFLEFNQGITWSIGLGENRSHELSVAELLKEPFLIAQYQDETVEIDYQIQRFNLRVVSNQDGMANDFQITFGNRLTPNQLAAISKLRSGGRLEFSDLVGTCDVCVLHRFADFVVEVH